MILPLCILAVCGLSAAVPRPIVIPALESDSPIKLFRGLTKLPFNHTDDALRRRVAGDASSSPSSGASSSSSGSSSPSTGSSSSPCSGSSCGSSGGASPSNGDIYETHRMFYMVIQAGAGQLALIADTGSESLVINSNQYDGSSDPDWSNTGEYCQANYGHGRDSYTGTVYTVPVTVDTYQQDIAVCLGTPSGSVFPGGGIMGLNLASGGPYSAYYETGSNVLSATGWSSFGIYLSQTNGDGELTPNGYNSAYFASGAQWTYEPVVSSDGRWTVGFTGFTIGSASGTPAVQQGTVDTGSGSLILDQASVDVVYSQLDFTGYTAPEIDCSQRGVAPPLVLTLGSGAQYSIPSTNYIEEAPNKGACIVGVSVRPAGKPMNLGFPLTSTYYASFDVANHQVGFIESIG